MQMLMDIKFMEQLLWGTYQPQILSLRNLIAGQDTSRLIQKLM